jgi:uncharacterized protein GlcG (DUF336 family)
MRRYVLALAMGLAVFAMGAQARAQAPAAVPEKMPFDIPYGTPITLDHAKQVADAAAAEAKKRDWKMAITVVDPNGDLIFFQRLDGTQLASVTISQAKARTAARFRRETRAFFNAMESGHPYVTSLDPTLVASPGGFPLIAGGKIIGAIGCSGGTGDQDAVVCKAGADTVK